MGQGRMSWFVHSQESESIMKTIKVSELSCAALDWAVAKCEGGEGLWFDTVSTYWVNIDGKERALSKGWAQSFTPSTDWAQGGSIIEREGINLFLRKGSIAKAGKPWLAYNDKHVEALGPTLLIAAMHCYVESKLGDMVEVPEELLKCL